MHILPDWTLPKFLENLGSLSCALFEWALEKDRTIVELAKLLLDIGANPNLTDGSYHSALQGFSQRP